MSFYSNVMPRRFGRGASKGGGRRARSDAWMLPRHLPDCSDERCAPGCPAWPHIKRTLEELKRQ
jgi:hypothetical protein